MPLTKIPLVKIDRCTYNEEFFKLIEDGRLNDVKEVFNNNSNIFNNIKTKHRETPLHVASRYGHLNIVKYLIENFNKIININIIDNNKQTALHIASEKGYTEIVIYLITKGANIDMLDSRNRTPLHCSVEYIKEETARYLISELKKRKNVNGNKSNVLSKKPYNIPYEIYHLNYENINIIKILIDNGVDVDYKTEDGGLTLLHLASASQKTEFIKYLVEDAHADINSIDDFSQTPLFSAVYYDKFETVKYLIDKGCDICHTNNEGVSILQILVSEQDTDADIVKYLVLKGAEIDVKNRTTFHYLSEYANLELFKFFENNCCETDIKDIVNNVNHDCSLLHYAVIGKLDEELRDEIGRIERFENAKIEMVKYLVEKYYETNIDIEYRGKTTLFFAIEEDNMNIVKYLIEKGANLKNIPNSVDIAAKNNNLTMIKYLVENGADINHKEGPEETTALISASVKGYLDIVKYLSTNSDINHKNKNGYSALHESSIMDYDDIVKHLLWSGADIDQLDNEGNTALHLAVLNKNHRVINSLIKNGANINIRNNEGKIPLDEAKDDVQIQNIFQMLDNIVDGRRQRKTSSSKKLKSIKKKTSSSKKKSKSIKKKTSSSKKKISSSTKKNKIIYKSMKQK
jgi:ankyrin repeat protein